MVTFDVVQSQRSTQVNYAQRDRFRSSRDLAPGVVKSRNLQGFIFGSDNDSATTSIDNGTTLNVTFDISQNKDYEIQGINYISIFVGSMTRANQIFPYVGSSQDITQWQIFGPAYDWYSWDANNYSASKDFQTLSVHNVSAGTVDIIIMGKWRYISPHEN